MPRFYFHTQADTLISDTEGVELADVEAARVAAAAAAGEVLKDQARLFWRSQPWGMVVTDHAGLIFFTLKLHGEDRPPANEP